MSALFDRQVDFAQAVARLISKAPQFGYAVTLGEAYRTPEQAAWNAQHGTGIVRSLHIQRLAIDLNVFRNGELITDGNQYKDLGEFWESLGGTWGQRFSKPDGNHFSFAWGGVK